MTTIWETINDVYIEHIGTGDPRVTPWFLMESPVPICIIISSYLAFVKIIGPAWMKNRKPFELRSVMFAYNMGLVITSLYLVTEMCIALWRSKKSFKCRIDDVGGANALRLIELGWLYFVLKLVELADTVFFVLRKKSRQISTLHVFHHTLVSAGSWLILTRGPGNYNYFVPLINTAVHIVMYTYYGLAALGPRVQKYLWWKKYLTTLQMMQFVLLLICFVSLILVECEVSKLTVYLNTFLTGVFLILFYNYFQDTYIKKSNK